MGNYCCDRSILLSKLKWVFAIFKLAKFSTVFSMFLSLGAYAVLYGWKFEWRSFICCLFMKWAIYGSRKERDPNIASNLYSIYGALIGMKEMPKNAKDEAYIAYMGPFFGLLSFYQRYRFI